MTIRGGSTYEHGEDGDFQMRVADTQNPLPAVMAAAIEAVLAVGAGGLMLLSDSRRMEPDLRIHIVLMLAAGVVVGAAMAWRWHRESSGRTADLGSVVRVGVIPLAAAVLVLWRSPTATDRAADQSKETGCTSSSRGRTSRSTDRPDGRHTAMIGQALNVVLWVQPQGWHGSAIWFARTADGT